MVIELDLTLRGKDAIQYTDGVLLNCVLETYIVLLTNVIPVNSIKIKKEKKIATGTEK